VRDDRATEPGKELDASDVVVGVAGDARLNDPAASGPQGADLSELPTVDVGDRDDPEGGQSSAGDQRGS
jgi:hypothetical protein